ncbi:MAG TPA: ABC transporter permease [Thermomicrobiales bacterium]|jgi:peptide/nickel transport system permease protein
MTAYLLRRLVHMVPVLFLMTLFVFFLVRFVPGDPATAMLGDRATPDRVARLNTALKLDRPYYVQYAAFLRNLAKGDLGESIRRREPVRGIVIDRMQPTLFLAFYAMLLSVLIAVPLATVAALKKGGLADQAVRGYLVLSIGMPTYWIGMMLLQFLAVKHRVFPVSGWGEGFFGHLDSLFLPALALALAVSSLMIRSLRNSILETLETDYVRTARAKGLGQSRIMIWHVMRNSALSTITILGINFAFLVGGATITETIFAIPGLGQLIVGSIFNQDYPVIQGVTLAIGVLVLLISLLTDICYALLDPRVSFE